MGTRNDDTLPGASDDRHSDEYQLIGERADVVMGKLAARGRIIEARCVGAMADLLATARNLEDIGQRYDANERNQLLRIAAVIRLQAQRLFAFLDAILIVKGNDT